MAFDIEDVHKNSKLLIDGVPWNVDDAEFVKPGKGRAIYRFRLRNLIDGSTLDRTYHSGEKVEEAPITAAKMQYLYREGEHYVFMNSETFEQHLVDERQMAQARYYLKEGAEVQAIMLGEKPIDITPPTFVELAVVKSGVSTKRETATAQGKAAELETGYTVDVPPFVKEGDIVKIDTRTGKYVERVGGKK